MRPENYMCPSCGASVEVGSQCVICSRRSKAESGRGTRGRRIRRQSPRAEQRHGWEQDKANDGLNLPEDDFDYEDFVAREFGGKDFRNVIRIRWYWWVTALGLLASLILLSVKSLR